MGHTSYNVRFIIIKKPVLEMCIFTKKVRDRHFWNELFFEKGSKSESNLSYEGTGSYAEIVKSKDML